MHVCWHVSMHYEFLSYHGYTVESHSHNSIPDGMGTGIQNDYNADLNCWSRKGNQRFYLKPPPVTWPYPIKLYGRSSVVATGLTKGLQLSTDHSKYLARLNETMTFAPLDIWCYGTIKYVLERGGVKLIASRRGLIDWCKDAMPIYVFIFVLSVWFPFLCCRIKKRDK